MEQAIEKQEEQKPTRRKKEKKGMPMLLQLVLLVVVIVVLRNVMGDGSGKGIFHKPNFYHGDFVFINKLKDLPSVRWKKEILLSAA